MTESNDIPLRVNLDEVRQAVLSGHVGIGAAGEGKPVLWRGAGSLLEHYLNLPPDRPETWKAIPGHPFYEASDKGRIRSIDRLYNGRPYKGQVIKGRIGNKGYVQVGIKDAANERVTRSVHRLVLLAHAGEPQDGQETCHGKYGPLVNWYPENLRWGTKPENEADKDNHAPPAPTYPCRNAPACGNMVINPNRRCRPCVARVGRKAGVLLTRYGMGLEDVAARCGYENYDWVWKIAREFGGAAMTKRDALRQRPNLVQRARITLRDRRDDGWGDAT